MVVDLKFDELTKKIEEKFGTAPFLGNYNAEQRREAVFSKLHENIEEYMRSKEDEKITDPVKRKMLGLLMKVKSLDAAVEKFTGPHFSLEFRKLNENCTKYQIDLNFSCMDEALDQERRMALTNLNEISERLYAKIHKGDKCSNCS